MSDLDFSLIYHFLHVPEERHASISFLSHCDKIFILTELFWKKFSFCQKKYWIFMELLKSSKMRLLEENRFCHSVWFHSGAKNHRVCLLLVCIRLWLVRAYLYFRSSLISFLSWELSSPQLLEWILMRLERCFPYWIIFRWKLLDNQFHLARNKKTSSFTIKFSGTCKEEILKFAKKDSEEIFFSFHMIKQY